MLFFFFNGKLTKKATFSRVFPTRQAPTKTQAILQEKLRLDREATKEAEASRVPEFHGGNSTWRMGENRTKII